MDRKLRIGVSACLLGENVRFDGGHQRDPFVVDEIGRFAHLVAMCPEMAIGLGRPRESLRLERDGDGGVRLRAPKSGADHTAAMRRWAQRRAARLGFLDGFILKKGSPSCGVERVRLYDDNGVPARTGRGLFAEALVAHDPLLPVEEDGRLNDPLLRDHFLTRVFARHRLAERLSVRLRAADLVRIQSDEKLLLMAHDPEGQRSVGRIVAGAGRGRAEQVAEAYAEAFMTALAHKPSRGRHANVLRHVLGYFKRDISRSDRHDLGEAIEAYEAGEVGRAVPLTLAAHYVRRTGQRYLAQQSYLSPYPRALMPRAPL